MAPGAQPQAAQRRPVAMLRNPFAPSALAVQADVLQRLALEQLEMVGSLASRGVRYALIQADGSVHRLQVGDRLGRDQGQVAEIGERHVEVIEQVLLPAKAGKRGGELSPCAEGADQGGHRWAKELWLRC
nr:pilus assembly protein PilP [Pseudomonas sp. BIGb0427]